MPPLTPLPPLALLCPLHDTLLWTSWQVGHFVKVYDDFCVVCREAAPGDEGRKRRLCAGGGGRDCMHTPFVSIQLCTYKHASLRALLLVCALQCTPPQGCGGLCSTCGAGTWWRLHDHQLCCCCADVKTSCCHMASCIVHEHLLLKARSVRMLICMPYLILLCQLSMLRSRW